MLEAERAALATEAYHNSLSILEREMGVLLQYLTNIGTQAALLGGFVFGSLATEVVKAGEDGQVAAWFEGLFLGASAFSFGMMMYTVRCGGALLRPSVIQQCRVRWWRR